MSNLILFTNSFLSYVVCFCVFVIAVLIAILIGTSLRKAKNAKELQAETSETTAANNSSDASNE